MHWNTPPSVPLSCVARHFTLPSLQDWGAGMAVAVVRVRRVVRRRSSIVVVVGRVGLCVFVWYVWVGL